MYSIKGDGFGGVDVDSNAVLNFCKEHSIEFWDTFKTIKSMAANAREV